MLCCIKSQPLAVFDLSVFYFLFSFWSIHTQLIKLNLCGGFFFLFPQSISLDSRSLMSDEVEGGVFCSSWYASEASFFFFDDQEFFTISDLLLPFKYWDSVLSFLSTRNLWRLWRPDKSIYAPEKCHALSLSFLFSFTFLPFHHNISVEITPFEKALSFFLSLLRSWHCTRSSKFNLLHDGGDHFSLIIPVW